MTKGYCRTKLNFLNILFDLSGEEKENVNGVFYEEALTKLGIVEEQNVLIC